MTKQKDTYGLIGKKLSHSFSADFFNKKFKAEEIDAEYVNIELRDIADFPESIKRCPNLKGLNVTIPYKKSIIPFLDELSPAAKAIGAVNTIQFKAGQLIGHNTDLVGFEKSLKPILEQQHQKALVLGTGGAARAVAYVLGKLKIDYQFVSRKASKNAIFYGDLTKESILEHKLIINSTPLGMLPNVDEAPKIPYEAIGTEHLLYDLIYNPAETLFLKKGQAQGAQIKNGLEMLELQALAAWSIWNK
ncbi:MAG: shikimate dehydrogenase [Chitinophagales bacterium]